MQIKKFENYESISLDTRYEIRLIDKNGDECEFNEPYKYDYNPFDLEEVVALLIKYEKKKYNLIIKKIVESNVDKETIDNVKMKLDAKKYNL